MRRATSDDEGSSSATQVPSKVIEKTLEKKHFDAVHQAFCGFWKHDGDFKRMDQDEFFEMVNIFFYDFKYLRSLHSHQEKDAKEIGTRKKLVDSFFVLLKEDFAESNKQEIVKRLNLLVKLMLDPRMLYLCAAMWCCRSDMWAFMDWKKNLKNDSLKRTELSYLMEVPVYSLIDIIDHIVTTDLRHTIAISDENKLKKIKKELNKLVNGFNLQLGYAKQYRPKEMQLQANLESKESKAKKEITAKKSNKEFRKASVEKQFKEQIKSRCEQYYNGGREIQFNQRELAKKAYREAVTGSFRWSLADSLRSSIPTELLYDKTVKKHTVRKTLLDIGSCFLFVAGAAALTYLTVQTFGLAPVLLGLAITIKWAASGSLVGASMSRLLYHMRKNIKNGFKAVGGHLSNLIKGLVGSFNDFHLSFSKIWAPKNKRKKQAMAGKMPSSPLMVRRQAPTARVYNVVRSVANEAGSVVENPMPAPSDATSVRVVAAGAGFVSQETRRCMAKNERMPLAQTPRRSSMRAG